MKKFIIAALAAAVLTGVNAMADQGITVYSNGNLVEDSGIIIDGRTLVPVRGVFEYLGYTADWQAETKTAVLTSEDGETVVSLTAGNTYFTVNGEEITPDVPQQLINGRFMLPLRSVGDALGAQVQWDADTKTAYITTDAAETEEDTEEDEAADTEKKTETVGSTTITSEVYVPFITIEAINPEEVPDGTVEIEVD